MDPSDALHARVTAFARSEPAAREPFDRLAVDIARFQAERSPGFARLLTRSGKPLSDANSIPAVPTDAFRATRVAAHPESLDAVRFVTSGTSGALSGSHAMRRTDTYRTLALAGGGPALLGDDARPRSVVALMPRPLPLTSSLAFMARTFMEEWDGRPLGQETAFDANAPARWLLDEGAVDVAGLEFAARQAGERGEPLLLLATSFALVYLLEALGHRSIETPAGTVVMYTGGFKGRARSVAPDALVRDVCRALGVPTSHVVGEYGMTELSSQLYEHSLAGASKSWPRGVYVPPPWLRVTAVDPTSLEPLPAGAVGLARFVDLGNVDSAVAIVTQDLVSEVEGGWQLQGRSRGAPPRGCSLAVEALLAESGAQQGV